MKKMKWINFICYLLTTYILSSLYGVWFRLEVPRILKIENLNNLSILFLVLLIIGYLITNFFKSLKEVFKSGAKKSFYVLVIIYGINSNNIALIYAISICLIVAYAVLFLQNRQIKKSEKNDESENKLELYPSRKNLMEVLNHALGEYSLVALDGTWGSGKTTFMNIVMRENREKYHYIPINVMLFENRNSLKTEFLNQLKGIFKEEGIFQGSLMDFDYYLDDVSNDWIKVVKNIIFSKSKSFKEANKKLKGEIGKIEKRIVVGVDNLERIYGESEPEWKQILGFIHELQELGIKIVVMANLEEMLTTKKETGEKDLSNYEYFDKFYEFKLKLNEVTTEEIIDGINFYNNNLFKEMLKKELKKLIDNLDMGYSIKENAKEVEETKDQYKELLTRYQNSVKNPRKIIKIVKDIENKKKTIKNIYKFIEDDEYEKLIFKASMFSLIYFDHMDEIKNEEFSDFIADKKININNFFGYFFKNIGESYRGLKRLLHRDAEEGLIIERIENIIKNKGKEEIDLEWTLKDLEIYSSILDPDYEQNNSKIVYKLIELKLQRLEKINIEKAHEIIKENEEFICKMNYLCNPEDYKFYEKIGYKFETQKINMQYRELINKFNPGNSKYNNLNQDIYMMISRYYIFDRENIEKVTEENIVSLIDLMDEEKNPNIIMELKSRSLDLFFSEEAERVKLKRMIALLNILKIEINKQNMENKKEGLIITVEEWKNMRNRGKFKVLQKLKDDYCYNYYDKKYENFEKVTRVLEEIIKGEKNEEFILKLGSLIESLKMHELPFQIIDMASKIKMEQNLDIKEEKKGELIDFINEKAKAENYQDIYSWDLWINKVKGIGIEVDLANKTVKKKNNDKA